MYVVGGRTGDGPGHACVASVQAYDPATNTWSAQAPLPAGRAALGLAALDGYLYALGGVTEPCWWGIPSDLAYRYHPQTDTWTSIASMPRARSNFVAGVIGNRIYVAGGSIRWPKTTDQTDVYDPASGRWFIAASMPAPRGGGMGGVWKGKLIVASGNIDAWTLDRRIFVYDAYTNQWSQPASISARSIGNEAGYLYAEGDCLYFAGGREEAAGRTWIIRLAPFTGQMWFLAPASPVARAGAAAACPPASRDVYVTGGLHGSLAVPATEKGVIHPQAVDPATRVPPVLDQESAPLTGSGILASAENGGNEIQQGIAAGLTGQLVEVELYGSGGTGTATFFINKGSPWQTDDNEFATTIRVTKTGWFSVDVSPAQLCFNKGERFVLGIFGSSTRPWHLGTSRSRYAAGQMWQQIGVSAPARQEESLAFRTHVDAYVPSPASR